MISIIIPAYNRVAALKRCIESVIDQVYVGLEVIVIDDFSKDSTRDYISQVTMQHSFIKFHYNDQNHGVNYSRNRGIEMASNPFILFLDSDDELIEGSLIKIKNVLEEYLLVKHFLFGVSDREVEFKQLAGNKDVQYEDWLNGSVFGDFTHVVSAKIMKKYLFFEEFRMFEHLNWIRVKKETSPQLMVALITTRRERDRTDSLTTSSKLQSMPVIRSKFESEKMFYSMYHKDLTLYNPGSLTFPLVKTILLGVACNQKGNSRSLIKYADKKYIKLLSNLLMLLPSSLIKYGIIKYSTIKGV